MAAVSLQSSRSLVALDACTTLSCLSASDTDFLSMDSASPSDLCEVSTGRLSPVILSAELHTSGEHAVKLEPTERNKLKRKSKEANRPMRRSLSSKPQGFNSSAAASSNPWGSSGLAASSALPPGQVWGMPMNPMAKAPGIVPPIYPDTAAQVHNPWGFMGMSPFSMMQAGVGMGPAGMMAGPPPFPGAPCGPLQMPPMPHLMALGRAGSSPPLAPDESRPVSQSGGHSRGAGTMDEEEVGGADMLPPPSDNNTKMPRCACPRAWAPLWLLCLRHAHSHRMHYHSINATNQSINHDG